MGGFPRHDVLSKGRAAAALLLSAPAVVWTADLLADTPWLILISATIPALVIATIVILLQRRARRPRAALALALLWGAIGAACVSSVGNEMARTWMAAGDDARTTTALLVAPALEEVAKALGFLLLLVVLPGTLRNARDGIVYGALIGIGFVWTENFLYLGVALLQSGEEGLWRTLYLRGFVDAAAHLVFTASAGAAIGHRASSGGLRGVTPAAGVLFAIAQHTAWNALAAPAIAEALCGATSGGQCLDHPTTLALFRSAPLITAVFLSPGIALTILAWRASKPPD